MFKKAIALFLLMNSLVVLAATEFIPLESIRTPSNDLIFDGEVITAEDAWRLEKAGQVDLSELNPEESVLWSDYTPQYLSEELDRVELTEDDEVQFEGSITSQSSIYRFNVSPTSESDSYFTVMLEKRLHTTLLRKNLLRKMGYVIPGMKYLKKLRVIFNSTEEKEQFLKDIPNATYGAPERWITEGLKSDSLEVTLQDIIVMTPKQSDHYNLAMGVPPRTLMSRTLRSLITPYAICDVPESINKMTWQVGRIANEKLSLPHFTLANMNATLADVKWAMRRISKLTREDFEQIVREAHYPKSVELVVIEKLIERRNSLNKLLNENVRNIEINEKVSYKNELKNGHLTREEWDGYAANFTHGAPDSPFQDFGYYILSELQSEVITNAMAKINDFLVGFDIGEERYKFKREEFQKGLEHYLETGEFLERKIDTWISPILNGNIIFSRDIVIGNQFGTDHLVQLADNFGLSVKLGAHLGIENLPQQLLGFAASDLRVTKTFTHLKPVTTLRQSLKEPYKNMIVPYFQRKLKNGLNDLGKMEGEDSDQIGQLMDYVNEHLGVGETLITTEKIDLSAAAQASLIKDIHKFTLGVNTTGVVIKRTQIYRKSADIIQVYVEDGASKGMGISFTYSVFIPIIRLQGRSNDGEYNIQVHNLNINPDLKRNPGLKENARALAYLIDEGSSELMDAVAPPYSLYNKFNDDSFKFALLNWRTKHLDKSGNIKFKTPEGKEVELVKITDEKSSGFNNRAFVTDIANFYLSKVTDDIMLASNTWGDQAHSYKGVSKKRISRFEARKLSDKYSDRFLSIQKNFQGWEIDSDDLEELIEDNIEDKYGHKLFDHFAIKEASGLMLYNVAINMNIYEEGIDRLKNMTSKELKKFQRDRGYVRRMKGCFESSYERAECGKLNYAIGKKRTCERKFKKNKLREGYACLLDVVTSLEKILKFEDMMDIIGKENIYIYGTINGFRKESEILNAPIESNTIGKINGRFWNGPVEQTRSMIGMTGHSFDGSWIREIL